MTAYGQDPNELGEHLKAFLEQTFGELEDDIKKVAKNLKPQQVLTAAQKGFQRYVDTDRFDYMAHVEQTFTSEDVEPAKVGIAITWKRSNGGQITVLFMEDVEDTDEVDGFLNTWTVLQAALEDEADVYRYLNAVPFDDRTIAGANQYLIKQAGAA